jgi:hypothetical protein
MHRYYFLLRGFYVFRLCGSTFYLSNQLQAATIFLVF